MRMIHDPYIILVTEPRIINRLLNDGVAIWITICVIFGILFG
jgi:hypothetical protein